MKILVVASKFPPEYSGPGVRIPRLYNDIRDKLGITKIDVICNSIELIKNETYQHENMTVKRVVPIYVRRKAFPFNLLPKRLFNAVVYFFESLVTIKALNKHKDVSYVHLLGHSGGTAAAIWWANKHNIPVLQELVNAEAMPSQRFLFAKVRPRGASRVITLTKLVADKCSHIGFPLDKIWCRPNPISSDKFFYEPEKKSSYRRAVCSFSDDDIVVASVAKIMPRKNQILLVRALARLPEEYKLIIAGPIVSGGPLYERDKQYLDRMYALIEEEGLTKRVQIVPDFVESFRYIKAADIYAMPAYNEGFGTPMLEAMACGVPVVANKDEVAFREWIEPGKNGYICDISDPAAWAEAMMALKGFTETQKKDMATFILNNASEKIIYEEYVQLIKNMCCT